jgi:hypothetical protein
LKKGCSFFFLYHNVQDNHTYYTYPTDSQMEDAEMQLEDTEIQQEDAEIHQEEEPEIADTMEDAEMKLEELEEHPEATQLELLMYEIEHLMEHGIQPSQEWWYQSRFKKISQYHELQWREFYHQYYDKNQPMAEMAERVYGGLHYLVEEWSVSSVFDLEVYDGVIHDINELWKYYSSEYVDESGDEDISQLMEGIRHL